MPILLLIRHGENDYVKKGRLAGRLPGVQLNDTGRSQAQSLADRLAKAPIKAIYCSPLERALETAEPLAKCLDLETIPRPGFLETDYGEWQGHTLKSLRRLKLWRTVQSAPSLARFPGGESFAECQSAFARRLSGSARSTKRKNWSPASSMLIRSSWRLHTISVCHSITSSASPPHRPPSLPCSSEKTTATW